MKSEKLYLHQKEVLLFIASQKRQSLWFANGAHHKKALVKTLNGSNLSGRAGSSVLTWNVNRLAWVVQGLEPAQPSKVNAKWTKLVTWK